MATITGVVVRRRRRSQGTTVVVPTAVRVEAAWDRRAPTAAVANRLSPSDAPLDTAAANDAAGIRRFVGVSVADAHLGATPAATAGPHAVLTSDIDDLKRIADHVGVPTEVIAV